MAWTSLVKRKENLSNIKLSNNIVTLPSYFAYDCKQLEAVQWGSNLKNIHGYAFKNCNKLLKILCFIVDII